MWEDDYPDMDRDNKNLIPSSRMRKKHKLSNTRIDATSVKPTMKYPACGTDIHRLSSRAASVKSMKRKFNIKMNTARYETERISKQAMDDVKRKDLPDPYAYSSWTRNVMRKRKGMRFTGRLKNIVKSSSSTERRFQALEVRFLRNLGNKILLREHTDRKVKVNERNCMKVWKKRKKYSVHT